LRVGIGGVYPFRNRRKTTKKKEKRKREVLRGTEKKKSKRTTSEKQMVKKGRGALEQGEGGLGISWDSVGGKGFQPRRAITFKSRKKNYKGEKNIPVKVGGNWRDRQGPPGKGRYEKKK